MPCPICYENEENIFLVKLTCGHSLCLSCLVSLKQRTCPICRSSFEKTVEKTLEKIDESTKNELVQLIKNT